MSTTSGRARRSGAQTRDEIRRVAMRLFTERGFDATSTRDIAADLGINQSSLYYHFKSKDEIVASLMQSRREEVEEFVTWLKAQPRTPDLLRTAALRWLDATTEEHIHAQRLALGSQAASQRRFRGGENSVPVAFEEVIAHFVDKDTPPEEALYVRTLFNAVGSVIMATFGRETAPADILAAARRVVMAMTSYEGGSGGREES
ncbi:TetR/AcrR family transcriptional regulator [Nonomuraea sp. NPDC050153]|uniref:TetR/AcrR family transcriptional regulator n=1 Tax=Nonomuraea sp. NPDC050153 TaxID=3364359 RepID=UPI00379A5E6A